MRIKIPHKLKANKLTSLPSQFIFFDTETKQVNGVHKCITHNLKLGWACYWQRRSKNVEDTLSWKEFTRIDDFWDFVESKVRSKTRLILMAHNIVFDFTVVGGWYELVNRGWQLTRLYEKNHIFIARYKKGSKAILVLDNMNYFACKLEQLGKEIGFEKLKIDFTKCTNKQLSIYCKRDVEILLRTWQKYFTWFKSNDLGTFGVTISGQAFNTFRHRFMNHDIFIHNRYYVSKLERESYFGGRTECFRLGSYSDDKYYNLDVNSMYPSVMLTEDFPMKFVNFDLDCGIGKLSIYLKRYCCVARVKVNTKKPILPVRKNIKVIFPVGSFEAVLTSGELKLALKENVITKVISVALYEKGKIFSGFVRFFYNQRLEAKENSNSSYSQFYKIIMNSLYGKFGQLMGEWETCGKCDPKEVKYWRESVHGDPKVYKYRKINGLIQRYEKKREAFNSFCAIASHVTGYARVKMWSLMTKAERENVYYCDTDSLFVNSEGYRNLQSELSSTEIGKLKIENEASYLKLLGCKQYIFGDKQKHKGRKNNAVKLSDNVYRQSQWSTLKTLIQNENLKDYRVTEVVKHFTGIYDKGHLLSNGTVVPLVL